MVVLLFNQSINRENMKRLLKILGSVLAAVILLVTILLAYVYTASNSRMNRDYHIEMSSLDVRLDSASVARGKYLFITRGCIDCHGENLGGKVFAEDPGIGFFYGSNLTTGVQGVAAFYTNEDFDRAIRHAIRRDGKPVRFMPSMDWAHFSDEDIAHLIAYIRSAPPVDSDFPKIRVGPLGRALFLAGEFPLLHAELIDHEMSRPATISVEATVEYGHYLTATCMGCHGNTLTGGRIPGTPPDWPPAANITMDPVNGLGTWTEEDFFRAMREGKRPDGSDISPIMPWIYTREMDDTEISAIWVYLRALDDSTEM
jgi:mono/diheme cytochrome c family protein